MNFFKKYHLFTFCPTQLLQSRLKNFYLLYNSQCDAINPMSGKFGFPLVSGSLLLIFHFLDSNIGVDLCITHFVLQFQILRGRLSLQRRSKRNLTKDASWSVVECFVRISIFSLGT